MHAPISAKEQEACIADLQVEVKSLEKELGEHEDTDAIVKKHITLHHRCIEAKDATKTLIGRLATLKETTVKQLHVNLDDLD